MIAESGHPPRPDPAFRVGVVGHRWDQLRRESVARITADAKTALELIRGAVTRVTADPANGYSKAPPRLDLVTALAEGADRIVADAMPDYQLCAVLPFGADEYRGDFRDPGPGSERPYRTAEESIAHFDALLERAGDRVLVMDGPARRGPGGARPFDAYVAGTRAVLESCDLLVAVWDGRPGRGVGGTAWVVDLARGQGVPVVRIDPSPSARAPTVWLEDLHAPAGTDHGRFDSPALGEALDLAIGALLRPPKGAVPDLRERFFAERLPVSGEGVFQRIVRSHRVRRGRRWWPPLMLPDLAWHAVASRLQRGGAESRRAAASWRNAWQDARLRPGGERIGAGADHAGVSPGTADGILARFGPSFEWADQLAGHYAARYRGAAMFVFSLSWLAVFGAALAMGCHLLGWTRAAWVAVGLELGVIVAAIAVVIVGRTLRYHEKWLHYRQLAERIRHLAILWPAARAHPDGRLGWRERSRAGEAAREPQLWVAWLVGALQRAAGFRAGDMAGTGTAESLWLLGRWLLSGQRAYASRAVEDAHRVARPLQWYSLALLFVAGGFAVFDVPGIGHAVAAGLAGGADAAALERAEHLVAWVALTGAVVGPAWAAALHGFMGQVDLEGSAVRYAHLAERLAQLETELERACARDRAGAGGVSSETVGEAATAAVAGLESDLTGWRTTFLGKPLTFA